MVSTAARAQSPGEQSAEASGIQEIVVTAQKREQNLQVVPVSVTAVTQDSLVANRIVTVQDLNAIAPNLTVRSQTGGADLPVYTIRGIYAAPAAAGADKGVSLYVDGVYVGNSIGSIYAISDIERIEVLKGPQGTLFGRNATGGAISITTMDPKGEFAIRQEVTVGNYQQFRSKTRVDTPAFGPLSASISYVHSERRGDTRNLGAGAVFDFGASGELGKRTSPKYLGDQNLEAIAAALKFSNDGPFEAIYKFDYTDNKYTPPGQGITAITPNSIASQIPTIALTAATINALYFQNPNAQTNPYPNLSPISEKNTGAVNNWFSFPARSNSENHSLTMTFNAGDHFSLRNVTGYRKSELEGGQQLDGLGGLRLNSAAIGSAIDLGGGNFAANPGPYTLLAVFGAVPNFLSLPPATQNQILLGTIGQLSGLNGQPFAVLANLAYFKSRQFSNEFQVNYQSDILTATAGFLHYQDKQITGGYPIIPNVLAFTPTPFGIVLPSTPPNVRTEVRVKSDAVYFQPEFHLTDKLTVVLGGRYTWDNKKYDDYTDLFNPQLGTSYSDEQFTYLVGANYEVSDDLFVYGKYSTGYISGGQVGGFPFQPEKAKSWEVGLKSELFDRTLRLNLALFDAKYTNLQYTDTGANLDPPRPSLATVVVNSGSAKATGFELETVLAPARGLNLIGNVGYTNFRFIGLNNNGSTIPIFRPKWTGNAAIQYETLPLPGMGDGHLSFRVDASYESKTYHNDVFIYGPYNKNLVVGSQVIFNSRVAIADFSMNGAAKGTVAIWGKNLTNNRSARIGSAYGFSAAANYRDARTYGLDFAIEF